MMFNVQWAMDQSMDLDPMSRLCNKLYNNEYVILCAQLYEFMKMAEY
jgi:hypothetical protein